VSCCSNGIVMLLVAVSVCLSDGFGGWSDISSLSASCVSLDDDTTVFTGVTYLGSALVDAPRSQPEITRNMVVLNSQHGMAIPVSLSVPGHSEGIVRYELCFVALKFLDSTKYIIKIFIGLLAFLVAQVIFACFFCC